ncbi:Bloom syndrome protein homolog [Gryllus bimaculatus]|nr:Bloom syndrome protein homolog [Gryllus bimaculatus]
MDEIIEVNDDEFDELEKMYCDVKGSSLQVKPTPVAKQQSIKKEEINEEEMDKLLRDVEWNEEPVKTTLKMTSTPDPQQNHLDILRKHFGHAKFRPMQWEIIYNIIKLKRDGCVIMATGYGKSLCYQFPPVFCNGTSLVITPLISLMEDQTLALEAANIPACYLGAGQSGQGNKMDKLVQGDYRVVYLTPEFCTGDIGANLFDRLLVSKTITLVAIDEAHCVSQWGHDFRHSYRRLGKIRDKLGHSVPILALTATATQQVQDDICSSLKLRNPFRICSGFDRPNLYLAVHQKGPSIINDLRRHMIRGEMNFAGPTIVYCPTKKATENVAKALSDYGVSCRYYHADLNAKLRKEVHHMFVRDEIQVIVATVAFGMGIDKPDVRLIIHYGAPKDMESYYQEVGRAGRDGLQSQCYSYFSAADFNTNQYFLSNLTGKAYEHRRTAMLKMEQYLQSRQCRRQFLLSHFEPDRLKGPDTPAENCCDNCTFRRAHGNKEPEVDGLNEDGTYDFGEDAELLLSAANFFGGRFGITMIITFLCGGKNAKFRESEMENEVFGKGKHKPKEWWRGLGRILLQEGYLQEVASKYNAPGKFPMNTIRVGKRGTDFLRRIGKEKISVNLYPTEDMISILKKKKKIQFTSSSSWNEPVILPLFPTCSQSANDNKKEQPKMSKEEEEKEGMLYSELLKLRNDLAKQHSYMPYMVANNKTLLDVASLRPSNKSELALVEGFNAAKIEKFGAAMLERVRAFCTEHGLAMKKIPTSQTETASVNQSKLSENELSATYSALPETVRVSYDLFQVQGRSLAAVASERSYQPSTIGGHLAEAVRAGLPLDMKRLGVTDEVCETIVRAIRSPPINSDISRLKPIKDNCPDHINYEQIKVTLAMLARKYGMKDNIVDWGTSGTPDLDAFRHVPTQKKTLSTTTTTTTTTSNMSSQLYTSTSDSQFKEQKAEKRKMDLSQFMQKRFKTLQGEDGQDAMNSPNNSVNSIKHDVSSTQKKDVRVQNVPEDDKSELWGDDDIFNCVDVPSETILVPDNKNQSCVINDLQRKPKDVQQEMKKKMKSSSLFRK